VSERRACRTLGQHRSTQRKVPQGRADEERLTDDIIELADQYGRYGYRMVTGLLNNAGWCVTPWPGRRLQANAERGQARRADLATRRAESPTKAKEERTALVERRVVRPAQAGTTQPCVVL
jgi:hypothetical protein